MFIQPSLWFVFYNGERSCFSSAGLRLAFRTNLLYAWFWQTLSSWQGLLLFSTAAFKPWMSQACWSTGSLRWLFPSSSCLIFIDIAYRHATVFGLPAIEAMLAKSVFAAKFCWFETGICFIPSSYDLFFGESALSYGRLLSKCQYFHHRPGRLVVYWGCWSKGSAGFPRNWWIMSSKCLSFTAAELDLFSACTWTYWVGIKQVFGVGQ